MKKNGIRLEHSRKSLTFASLFRTTDRALSSAGSERLPYKQRVGGSNPSAPTKHKGTPTNRRSARFLYSGLEKAGRSVSNYEGGQFPACRHILVSVAARQRRAGQGEPQGMGEVRIMTGIEFWLLARCPGQELRRFRFLFVLVCPGLFLSSGMVSCGKAKVPEGRRHAVSKKWLRGLRLFGPYAQSAIAGRLFSWTSQTTVHAL